MLNSLKKLLGHTPTHQEHIGTYSFSGFINRFGELEGIRNDNANITYNQYGHNSAKIIINHDITNDMVFNVKAFPYPFPNNFSHDEYTIPLLIIDNGRQINFNFHKKKDFVIFCEQNGDTVVYANDPNIIYEFEFFLKIS